MTIRTVVDNKQLSCYRKVRNYYKTYIKHSSAIEYFKLPFWFYYHSGSTYDGIINQVLINTVDSAYSYYQTAAKRWRNGATNDLHATLSNVIKIDDPFDQYDLLEIDYYQYDLLTPKPIIHLLKQDGSGSISEALDNSGNKWDSISGGYVVDPKRNGICITNKPYKLWDSTGETGTVTVKTLLERWTENVGGYYKKTKSLVNGWESYHGGKRWLPYDLLGSDQIYLSSVVPAGHIGINPNKTAYYRFRFLAIIDNHLCSSEPSEAFKYNQLGEFKVVGSGYYRNRIKFI